MADVFISYAHEDQPFARRMAQALESEGFRVWWDHSIPPGQTWDEMITRNITDARCCLVLWSERAVISDWVKEEATIAKDQQKFIPVQLDNALPPVGFRRIRAALLQSWKGDVHDPQWRALVREVSAASGVAAQPHRSPPRAPSSHSGNGPPPVAAAMLALAGVVAVGALLIPLLPRPAPAAAPVAEAPPAQAAPVAAPTPTAAPPAEQRPEPVVLANTTWVFRTEAWEGTRSFRADGTFYDSDGTTGTWRVNGRTLTMALPSNSLTYSGTINGARVSGVRRAHAQDGTISETRFSMTRN